MTDTGAAPTKEQLIARYKTILRELIDKRPSGTRLKIAAAIGRHKSFVSQIRAAHPNQFAKLGTGPEGGAGPKQIRIELPAFDDAGRQREVEATIRDLAKRIIALALDK
jgi:hypothetical protein